MEDPACKDDEGWVGERAVNVFNAVILMISQYIQIKWK